MEENNRIGTVSVLESAETEKEENKINPASGDERELPLIAIRDRVIFPKTAVNFDVGREKSNNALKAAESYGGMIFLTTQRNPAEEDVKAEGLYYTGVVCRIRQVVRTNGTAKVMAEALYRARIAAFLSTEEYFKVVAVRSDYKSDDEVTTEAAFRVAKTATFDYARLKGNVAKEILETLSGVDSPDFFIDNALTVFSMKEADKQTVLEEDDTVKRLELYSSLLLKETEIVKVQKDIDALVRKRIEDGQKEYYLREQLKAIHTELGDDESLKQDYIDMVKSKNFPQEIEEKLMGEINRLDKINPSSPDYSVILNYLDWIKDIPFNVYTEDEKDLKKAKDILEEDHFGLEKIKERIVEYLAVLKLTGKLQGQILCFVGPPGVGKTSIATSIARATGRKFVRMSLGGIKDEAEIRGHRKTYVGAMPGRIIYGLKQAKSMNPVFLLDEIDKISADIHGDPASALLEVLDPEQNSTFRDRFIEIPVDLSKVMFITTANTLDTIPAPLLDRMEVINLSGYTETEKLSIAEKYLVRKANDKCGLSHDKIKITKGGLEEIISGYTMEAGVRNLEREIETVTRKVAAGFALGKYTKKQIVDKERVNELLGAKRKYGDLSLDKDEVGACTGLAWTAYGGTTLTIEVSLMSGKGEIILTGKLGDVMKESARAGISYIRANAKKYGIDEKVFETTDIHVHVPEGATPKDGPSAGITMATAVLSAFTGREVKRSVAMTGELTLRGKVLPIGGLKEKSLAAYREGIKTVIIPEANTPDLKEIPEEVRKKMEFVPVSTADEVFEKALK